MLLRRALLRRLLLRGLLLRRLLLRRLLLRRLLRVVRLLLPLVLPPLPPLLLPVLPLLRLLPRGRGGRHWQPRAVVASRCGGLAPWWYEAGRRAAGGCVTAARRTRAPGCRASEEPRRTRAGRHGACTMRGAWPAETAAFGLRRRSHVAVAGPARGKHQHLHGSTNTAQIVYMGSSSSLNYSAWASTAW